MKCQNNMIKTEMPAKPPKEKRRNNEKRKEKSRDAARCRRSRETEIFSELAHSLPIAKDEVDQLDKASVMRLVISHLKVRSVMQLLPELPIKIKAAEESSLEELPISKELSYLKALDGFVLVISPDGDLIYLSENVNEILGVSQMDLMGQSVFEFSHPCDHEEIRDVLSVKSSQEKDKANSGAWETPKSFFIRMKCTLTSKGRNVNLKSASYKVIHCTGHILTKEACNMIENNNNAVVKSESNGKNSIIDCIKGRSSDDSMDTDSSIAEVKEYKPIKKMGSLVAIGRPIPHPSSIEVPLFNSTFMSKHSLDMKFTYADECMLDILGYDPQDLTGKSVYDYHHSIDSSALSHNFKCLFSKGQCETGRYRFLAKNGGYAWLITQATLMMDKQQKPLSVVCVNYVVSGVECRDEILSCSQARAAALQEQQRATAPVVSAGVKPPVVSPPIQAQPAAVPIAHVLEGPQPATAKIFAPRTEEMNKGFLMFSEEEPGLTMLKEEPEDLTHLAPTAGDVCIPLEDSPFIDMFDEFILGDDNYCGLLPEGFAELVGPGDADDRRSCHLRTDDDPFATPSYRDDDADSRSPLAMSPCVSKSSDIGSLPSLCSPGGSLPEEELNASPLLTELGLEGELDARAPYIPMGPSDQLPIHLGDHHNHRQSHLQQQQPPPLADGRVMWGALPDHLTLHMSRRAGRPTLCNERPVSDSNLARLLATPAMDCDQDIGSKSPVDDSDVSSLCLNNVEKNSLDAWRTEQRNSLESLTSKRQQSQFMNCGDIPTTISSVTNEKLGSKRSASPASGNAAVKRSRSRRQPQEKVSLQQPPPPPAGSVLMNLLVSGCDEKFPMAPPLQKQKEQIQDPMYHRPPPVSMSQQWLEPPFLTRFKNSLKMVKGDVVSQHPQGMRGFVSPFQNVLQCETDPILTTAVVVNHSPGAVAPLRKTSLDRLLDGETSMFPEMTSGDWSMSEDELLQGSDLLGTFDTPI